MSTMGDMLRIARQRLGLTQKAAASRLGVVQPVLSRFENGLSETDQEFRAKASTVYQVPIEFFDIREPVFGPPVSVHPMLRGKADVTAREIDLISADLNIRIMHLRTFLEGVDFDSLANLPILDVEQYGSPSKIAATVRAHWGIPAGPLKNLMAWVERAGVVVGLSSFGGASVSGVTFNVPGLPPLVLLNIHQPADRMRFTLAHELGHLVMHRFPTSTMEDEANEFAAEFLMPASDIRSAFRGRKITLELLAALKPEWKVAMQALLVRASTLEFVTPNQSRYLWQQISARGWRLNEPAELNFPTEKTTVLDSMIQAHLSELGYSLSELCGMLAIHEEHFVEMYGTALNPTTRPNQQPRLRIVD